MGKVTFEEMLNAGVHFGHLRRKWNPNMSPYIFDEKKGIHIIDLNKTLVNLYKKKYKKHLFFTTDLSQKKNID